MTYPRGHYTLRRQDGTEVLIELSSGPIRDQFQEITGVVLVFHDVSTARAKSLELSHLAQHDFLTDLPNRVLLNDRINQAIAFAERYSKQLAVMFVDLDHFKKINDTTATPSATNFFDGSCHPPGGSACAAPTP